VDRDAGTDCLAMRTVSFTTWTALDGLGSDLVGAMWRAAMDRCGSGTLGGLSHFREGKYELTTRDGLSSSVVTALHEDHDGTLWIGTK